MRKIPREDSRARSVGIATAVQIAHSGAQPFPGRTSYCLIERFRNRMDRQEEVCETRVEQLFDESSARAPRQLSHEKLPQGNQSATQAEFSVRVPSQLDYVGVKGR